MNRARWERMWSLFHEAAEIPHADRDAFLQAACADDAGLRDEIRSLLDSHERSAGILDDNALPGLHEQLDSMSDPMLGERIGPYRLSELIGEGGMGVVYSAEQEEPVRRRVALKLIRLGMDTRQVVARFEAERQALAMMDHSSIARVFDAGSTEAGRPYFVMELVEGVPITTYCDTHRLDTRRRLELLLKVCDGVRHAHQKGIIHRDLKPSNVLVTLQDDEPAPKIIDFGVAKATEQQLTEKTMFTAMGAWVGTPEYMSPEQAELTDIDVDTRTDVYALGVLLYELMAGALPFDPADLREASLDEIRRKIREDEPPRPSSRVSKLGDEESAHAAERRRTDVPTLRRALSGDLDWITMKALEKERARRYGSVAELANDISRHLRHEPVTAGPPSPFYRGKKFLRRHRFGVSIAALGLLSLVVLGVTMMVQAGRIARERDRATLAAERAQLEAETAGKTTDFLLELFEVSDPREARGASVTAREILDRGAERIETELADQPEVRARLLGTLGRVYENLGLFSDAEPFLLEAAEIRRDLVGESHPDYADAIRSLGTLRSWTADYDEAVHLFERALEIHERSLEEDDPRIAQSAFSLGETLSRTGEYARAAPLLEKALRIYEQDPDSDPERVLESIRVLAWTYRDMNDLNAARRLLERGVELAERELEPDHPTRGRMYNILAVLHWTAKDFEAARPLLLRALEIFEKVYPPDHPSLSGQRGNVGRVLMDAGDPESARPHFQAALAAYERTLPPDHPDLARAVLNLALVHRDTGEHEAALAAFDRGLPIWEEKLGPAHRYLAEPLSGRADVLQAIGRLDEARPLYERAIRIREDKLGAEHPDLVVILEGYARLLRSQEEPRRADEIDARIARIETIRDSRTAEDD